MRDNPFLQNQRFAIASRISFASFPTIDQLVALVMIHGLSHGDGRQFSWSISVNIQPQTSKYILQLLTFFRILLDGPDGLLVVIAQRARPSLLRLGRSTTHRVHDRL
jgi:hypothetical protein